MNGEPTPLYIDQALHNVDLHIKTGEWAEYMPQAAEVLAAAYRAMRDRYELLSKPATAGQGEA